MVKKKDYEEKREALRREGNADAVVPSSVLLHLLIFLLLLFLPESIFHGCYFFFVAVLVLLTFLFCCEVYEIFYTSK